MKKKITLITSILLILALAVTFVGCNKDKTEETPTTTEKVSTTEPTTKFEAPEIKDEPTTEETTEETEASETTTKKSAYTGSSNSSSSSGSSNSGSNSKPSSKPASTTKANSSGNQFSGEVLDDGSVALVTNANGGGVYLSSDWGQNTGSESPVNDGYDDPEVQDALGHKVGR